MQRERLAPAAFDQKKPQKGALVKSELNINIFLCISIPLVLPGGDGGGRVWCWGQEKSKALTAGLELLSQEMHHYPYITRDMHNYTFYTHVQVFF